MKNFKVPRNDGETWLGATLRHATPHGYAAVFVTALFAKHVETTSEEEAALFTLLELDILPLVMEGVSGT
jgi:hypothetical protein